MLEGKPLQYYTPSLPVPIPTSNSFSYFNRFQCFGSPSMSDDLVMPHSPNGSQVIINLVCFFFNRSSFFLLFMYMYIVYSLLFFLQSDSDNSVSSVEIFPKEIRGKQVNNPSLKKVEDVQCRWISCGIVFESLDQLATHVGRVHAASGPDGLFYCGWEGCSRNNKGFNAR